MRKNLKKITPTWFASKSKKGFTLIELLIYMGLFCMFVVVMSEIFVSAISTQLESEATSTTDQDGRFIFLHMDDALKNAEAVIQPAGFGSPDTSLVITGQDGNTHTYSLQGGNLVRTVNGETNQLNSMRSRITSITFEKIGNSGINNTTVQIVATIESTVSGKSGPDVRTFQFTVGTRPGI